MSRPFRDKNKDLIKLEVVISDKVWTKDKSGKPKLRKDLDIYGRVDKGTSAFVTSTNLLGSNHRIVEDTFVITSVYLIIVFVLMTSLRAWEISLFGTMILPIKRLNVTDIFRDIVILLTLI